MGQTRQALTALTAALLLTACGGSPDGEPHEQRQWASNLVQEWTGAPPPEAATTSQHLLNRAGLSCTLWGHVADPEAEWGRLDHPKVVASLYITYATGCPELLEDYEDWLEATDNWP